MSGSPPAAAAALIIGILVPALGGCADRLLLFPPAHAIAGPGVQRRMLDHGNKRVEVFTARSRGAAAAEPRAFMLEFTGNMTRAEHIVANVASRWGDRPVETWVMNYPGYGGSEGGARLRDIPPAALAAYDELARVAAGRPIFVAGQSLGSIPALYVAAKRPVAGVVIQNPPSIPAQIWQQHGWWNLWLLAAPVAWQIPAEMNSPRVAKRVTAPGVILIAGRDRVVPPRFQRAVANAYAGAKVVIVQPDAGHDTRLNDTDLARLVAAMGRLFDRATASE